MIRRGDAWMGLLAVLVAAACVAVLDAGDRRARQAARDPAREAVRELGLADLCLTTEARYTRHPAQADRFAPFQDLPGAFEYAPSGAWMAAPRLAPGGTAPVAGDVSEGPDDPAAPASPEAP